MSLDKEVEGFLKEFPDYKEVKFLLDYFKEISNPPYDKKNRSLYSKTEEEKMLLRLYKEDNGAILEFGHYSLFSEGFWRDASIYAGLVQTGVWMIGSGNENKHDIYLNIRNNISLENKYYKKLFNFIVDFYLKFQSIKLESDEFIDKEKEFTGSKERPD